MTEKEKIINEITEIVHDEIEKLDYNTAKTLLEALIIIDNVNKNIF